MSIEIRNISKQFTDGTLAIDHVSFQIEEGEMIGFLGPSGGGKTTLLRIIAGLEPATSGEVYIKGQKVDHLPPQKRGVGFVFQNYALFKHMTVFENIAFGLRIQNRKEDEIRDRVRNLLRLVRLPDLENRYPDQLSGGQRQRVAFARALAPEPKVLLLDEPFAAIDAKIRQELRKWVRQIHDEIGITSIFVTHDQEEALEIADRVLVINQGQVEQLGTPQEIYDSPSSRFVAGFIGDVNEYTAAVKSGEADLGPLRFPAANFAEGSRVSIVIRPSDVLVRPLSEQLDAIGEVKRTIFRGDLYSVFIELDQGIQVHAAVSRQEQELMHAGELVSIQIRSHKLFPK